MAQNDIQIALVAACDRYNYGDVLMPIIFEEYYLKYAKKKAEFTYYGLSKKDLRDIGGRRTDSLFDIPDDTKYIILAGGEVLNSQYTNMFLNLQTNAVIITFFNKLSRISGRLNNLICKKLLRGENILPWSIFPKSSDQKVFYNAVGGVGTFEVTREQQEEILKVIDSSEMFSVRDKKTYEILCGLGADEKLQLIPDTAIYMSRLYPLERLKDLISDYVRDVLCDLNTFYVVQMNKRFGDKIKDYVIDAINEFYEKEQMTCILLPIGRAQGHEDILPLREVKNRTKNGACILIEENNIFDVMYIIATSKAYLGTSLHGIITAASYGIPHTVISSIAEKTKNFVLSWNTTSVVSVDGVEQFMDFIGADDLDSTVQVENINDMKTKVENYFNGIIKIIEDDDGVL